MRCDACTDGMNCDKPGLVLSSVEAESGWWRGVINNGSAFTFLQCLQPSNCVDGRCAANRVGALCAVCESGYHQSTQGSECEKCASQSTSIAGTIGFSILIVAAMVGTF